MQDLKWRRTVIGDLQGRPVAVSDDWALADGRLSLARIYRYMTGPAEGQWAWFVQVTADGAPGNGGDGVAATGAAAREACEARLPEFYRARLQRADAAGGG